MSSFLFCDRCGERINKKPSFHIISHIRGCFVLDRELTSLDRHDVDLCKDCLEKFADWLKRKE